ncbi:hypothetical protein FLAG1_07164 [Fusarium langsethiae]|uniref:Uncharacterized protein n=1 Tax=Fusarium langsethiae TaxID=179993 RepID=A0A0M9EUX0_FUSLA|nr:hypothetical protein FLAG1_07164 [Fusarium langsethiae]
MDTDAGEISFWKPKSHDTAKLPAVYRRMVVYRAQALLERLIDVRDFAMEFASEEALLRYAKAFILPSPDEQEEEDLRDFSEGSDSNLGSDSDENEDIGTCEDKLMEYEYEYIDLAENIAANQRDSDTFTGTADIDMDDTEPIWDGAIHGYDWPNIEEPSEDHSESSDEEDEMADDSAFDPFETPADSTNDEPSTWLTNTPDAPYGTFFNTFVTFLTSCVGDNQVALSTRIEHSGVLEGPAPAWLGNDSNAPNGAAEAETSSETWSDGMTTSLLTNQYPPTPQDSFDNKEDEESWSNSDSSDEISSQAIDEQMEELRLAPSTLLHSYGWYWPTHFLEEIVIQTEEYEEYIQKKKAPVESISENKTLSPAQTERILYEFVRENIACKPIVNAKQLLKLKRFIDNIARFILSTQKNIDAIDADMDEGRRRHFLPLDSSSRFRSKRLGSSLRFVTGVNEEWEQSQDDWGMPPVKKKREQIRV